jgi:gliding motility-associated-like protein
MCFSQETQWIKTQNNESGEVITSCITTDKNNNTIVGGRYKNSTIYFSPDDSLTNQGNGFLAKYDPQGQLLWTITNSGGNNSWSDENDILSIKTGHNNDIYAIGIFKSDSIRFSNSIYLRKPTDLPTMSGFTSGLFVVKFDSLGIAQWANAIYGEDFLNQNIDAVVSFGYRPGFTLDNNDNPILTFALRRNYTVSFRDTSITYDKFGLAIVKYDYSNGNMSWSRTYEGSNQFVLPDVTTDENNEIYISGVLIGSLVFGSDTIAGNSAMWDLSDVLLKLTSSGNPIKGIVVSAKTSTSNSTFSKGRVVNTSNRIICINSFLFSSLVDTIRITNINNTLLYYIAFYDYNLNLLDVKQFDSLSSSNIGIFGLTSSDSFLYFAGFFDAGSISIGNITLTNNSSDRNLLLAKMDTLGNVLWAFSNDRSAANAFDIATDTRGDVYVVGNFDDSIHIFDKSAGGSTADGYVAKITDYSITRGEVFAGPYCAGDSMDIPYTIKGIYDPGNRFIAQLSDENGNFDDTAKIRTLGWIESTEDSVIRGELPLFEVSSSGNYRIRVISTNPPVQSFYKEDSLRLLIYSRDKADPGPDETICLGDSFQLNTFGGTAWEWSPAINMDDSTLRQPTVWPSTNTTYRIVISDSSGCGEPDTAFKNILIRPNPKIDLPSDNYIVCLREPSQIQAHFYDGDTSGYRWSWRLAQGIWQELNRDSFRTSTAVDFALTSTTPRSRLLAIILEDGCHPKPDTAFVNVRLSPHRVRSILSTQDSVICYQSQQNLIANISGGDSLTYQWQWFEVDAMGEFSLIKQDSLRFSDTLQVQLRPESKDFQRYALVSNDNCIPFFDTAYLNVNINPHQPQAGILPTDTAICPSTVVELVGQVDNGSALGYAFIWLDETNTILQSDTGFSPQNFSLTPDFSGGQSERMYRLIAQDLCSPNADTAQTRITPREPLQAIPNTFDTTVCFGTELSLSASGLGGDSSNYQYQWILNDRLISSDSDVMVTLREPQGNTMSVQNLKLVISDNCMPQNDTADITVRVKPALQSVILREPHHDHAVQDTTVCSGSELRFFAKAFGGDSTNYSFEWLWNDSLMGTQKELVFVPIHPSPSTLHLITKDGCTVPNDTTSVIINILPPSQVSFTAADTLCLGEELELIAEANGGVDSNYMYQWILNGNIVSETDSFILNGIHPSPSTLQLILSDGCSSPNDTFTHTFIIRPSLTIDLSASTPCANPTTTITANPTGGNADNYIIKWFDEAGNMIGEGLSIEVTPTRLTTYRATLSDGCSADTASAQIQIDLIPSILELTASPTQGCEPLPVDFEVNTNYSNTFIYTLLFTPSDSSQSLPPTNPPLSFTFSQGIYTPTLILTTQLGCDTTLTGPTITIHPKPTAAFSFSPEEPDLDNNSVQFRNLSTGANSYVWSISPFGNFTEAEPNVIYTDSGFHPLQLIAISNQDCRDTVQGQVYIRTNYRVYIPNVFSPNGDGKNDLFRPAMRGFAESDLNIYNRWGERLFQSRDNTGWDGTYRGQPVPKGVYMYTLSVLNLYGEKQFFNGTVVLMR